VAVVSDDDELLERVRRLLSGHPDVEEKPMVGGRGFLVRGRMCCGVTRGGLWVRVGRGEVDAALGEPYVSRAAMGGRSLSAFVVVAPHGVATEALLEAWVQRGMTVVSGRMVQDGPKRIRRGSPPAAPPAPPAALGLATERFAELVEQFVDNPAVVLSDQGRGRRFGSSALKVDGSIFAMLTRDHLVVKLPRARVSELIADGTGAPFTGGQTAPMKEWLTVTTDEASTWLALTHEALAFVSER
jgi:TfoX/Sxy family transcriptional regulator of competence genes